MRFLISAPEYNGASGGISALYELHDDLKTLGYESEILLWTKFHNLKDDDIVIYPEVVSGNPLLAKNVVRYVLNRDGVLTGNKMNESENDFIFSWARIYHPSSHANLLKYSIPEYFNDVGTKSALDRHIDCTYVGKGSIYKNCPIIQNTVEINKNNPISKMALADLLRHTRLLYTYDILTSVVNEAILCGAMVVPLYWNPFTEDEMNNSDYKFPYISVLYNHINIPINYSNNRERYINNIKNHTLTYMNKLDIIAKQILRHFGSTSV